MPIVKKLQNTHGVSCNDPSFYSFGPSLDTVEAKFTTMNPLVLALGQRRGGLICIKKNCCEEVWEGEVPF